VAAVYTPKDFGLTEIMGGIVDVIRKAHACSPVDLRQRSPGTPVPGFHYE
jgi:hypothetical protein